MSQVTASLKHLDGTEKPRGPSCLLMRPSHADLYQNHFSAQFHHCKRIHPLFQRSLWNALLWILLFSAVENTWSLAQEHLILQYYHSFGQVLFLLCHNWVFGMASKSLSCLWILGSIIAMTLMCALTRVFSQERNFKASAAGGLVLLGVLLLSTIWNLEASSRLLTSHQHQLPRLSDSKAASVLFNGKQMPSSQLSFFVSASEHGKPQTNSTSLISSYSYLLDIRNGFTNQLIFPTKDSLTNLLLNILQIQKPDGRGKASPRKRSRLVEKTLLAITTKNLLHITKLTFYALRLHKNPPDILIVDDHSMENVVEELQDTFGKDLPIVGVIKKKQAKGLTDSWNRAYQWFKERKQYEFLILSNNDVLIPEGAIKWLSRCVASGYPLCKPLGTSTGVGDRPNQDAWRVLRGIMTSEYVHQPENYIKIQRLLESRRDLVPFWRDNFPFNGFFFALRRDAMELAEFDPENNLLFDPKYVNVKNEFDLTKRIGKSFHALCQKCFVLHFKNLTIQKGEKKGKEEKLVGDWRELILSDAGHYSSSKSKKGK